MSDAIKIFSSAAESNKKVGINIPATMTTAPSAALYVNGDIETTSEVITPVLTISEDGIFTLGTGGELDAGALVATDDKIKIGGGTLPSSNTMALASNWLMDIGGGIVLPVTNDILADALAMPAYTTKAFRGSGTSYTGTLPGGSTNWAYGSFIVLKRNSTYHQVIAVNNNSELAVNSCNNGTTWIGWRIALCGNTVTKTATISFSAGTIGTRGFQTSWTASQIGGNPYLVQITEVVASNEYHPFAFISGTTVYLNAYRCVSSAVAASSNRQVYVTIYYR